MMKIFLCVVCSLMIFTGTLSAQQERVVVKAGREVKDFFPFEKRYRYAEFVPGKAISKNGLASETLFNYNILNNSMDFLKVRDTLRITNGKDLRYVVIQADTFYYDNGFIEIISDGKLKLGLKQYFKLDEVQKTDSYGIASNASSRESYSGVSSDGNFYRLKAPNDMIFVKAIEYYIAVNPQQEFVFLKKNNVLKLFPDKADKIKEYLKKNKVDFDSEKDLITLTKYIESL